MHGAKPGFLHAACRLRPRKKFKGQLLAKRGRVDLGPDSITLLRNGADADAALCPHLQNAELRHHAGRWWTSQPAAATARSSSAATTKVRRHRGYRSRPPRFPLPAQPPRQTTPRSRPPAPSAWRTASLSSACSRSPPATTPSAGARRPAVPSSSSAPFQLRPNDAICGHGTLTS